MGRKSNYNFQEIEKLKSYGLSFGEIAERLGHKELNVKRAYYRWIERKEQSSTETKEKAIPKVKPKTYKEKIKVDQVIQAKEFSEYVRENGDYVDKKRIEIKAKKQIKDTKGFKLYLDDSDTLRQFYRLVSGKRGRDRADITKMKIITVLLNSIDEDLQNLFKLVSLSDG